ncbi:HNH endonuclease [Nostoc sp.]|uniref:HNH endonuclease n=1 Tax=Nostoc sp. TaxID=1180 RepID=UPI002FF451BA
MDVRTFVYKEESQSVGVTLMCGRVEFKLSIGGYQIALLRGQSPTSATLNRTKQGQYNIHFVVDIPTQPTGKTPVLKSSPGRNRDAQTFRKVIGVDLGRRDIATTSTGKSWSGKQIQSVRDRYSQIRANVQSKRTRSSRRLLRRLFGRERKFQEWLNHNISKQLVQDAKRINAALAFEDLTNIRESLNQKRRSKVERRRTNHWAFYQLRLFSRTPIVRHVKVRGEASPFDGNLIYWSSRMGIHPEATIRMSTLLKKQKGKCNHCGLYFREEDVLEIDHIIPKILGGKDEYKNLQIFHRHCHDMKTTDDGSAVGTHDKRQIIEEPDEVESLMSGFVDERFS